MNLTLYYCQVFNREKVNNYQRRLMVFYIIIQSALNLISLAKAYASGLAIHGFGSSLYFTNYLLSFLAGLTSPYLQRLSKMFVFEHLYVSPKLLLKLQSTNSTQSLVSTKLVSFIKLSSSVQNLGLIDGLYLLPSNSLIRS